MVSINYYTALTGMKIFSSAILPRNITYFLKINAFDEQHGASLNAGFEVKTFFDKPVF